MTRPLSGASYHPWAALICAVATGWCTGHSDIAAVFSASASGALIAIHARLQVGLIAVFLAAGLLFLYPMGPHLPTYGLLVLLTSLLALTPRPLVSATLRLARWSWQVASLVTAVGICGMLLDFGVGAALLALPGAAFLGGTLTRQLAMVDARLLAWGDDGLNAVTRDLLLGRVTSGMLHDLAQPLNVISMANGNMGYIVEHLEIDDAERRHLLDRIERIALHTQSAATILSLFRWFGRDGSDDPAALTVRSALERSLAATRSNVRHHGVEVALQGNGLDYLLPARHGALEMMAVAALLCVFSSFVQADGTKLRGKVLLHAVLSPAHIVISVQCIDPDGKPIPGKQMDEATAWLVGQVAQEVSGDFRCLTRDSRPERFVIRLGRDDT